MIRKIARLSVSAAGLCVLLGAAQAQEMHPYSEPLPIPGYITEIEPILNDSFERYGWSLEPQGDGTTYKGTLSYKGFDVAVTVTVKDQEITIMADSAHATGCSGDCEDLRMEAHVLRWISSLRRSVALDITHQVKAHLSI